MACDLIEPFAAAEFFVDGWSGHEITNGIFSCVGYRCQSGQKIAVVRVAMRLSDVPLMQANTRAAIAAAMSGTPVVHESERLGRH